MTIAIGRTILPVGTVAAVQFSAINMVHQRFSAVARFDFHALTETHDARILKCQSLYCMQHACVRTLTQFHGSQPKLLLSLASFQFHQAQRVISSKVRSANRRSIGGTVEYTRAPGKSVWTDFASGVEVTFDIFAHVVVAVHVVFDRSVRF